MTITRDSLRTAVVLVKFFLLIHLTLVIALAGAAEPVVEQVVGLQLGEGTGALATAVPQNPGHGQLGVVVQNALGHPAQEGESGDMAVQERLN